MRTGSSPSPRSTTKSAVTAEKVPEFLRTARKLSTEQWDRLIEQTKRMLSRKGER